MEERKSMQEEQVCMIVNFNLIKRFCDSIGTDTSWYDMLGDLKKDPTVRKRFGDFADYLCFVEAINQR